MSPERFWAIATMQSQQIQSESVSLLRVDHFDFKLDFRCHTKLAPKNEKTIRNTDSTILHSRHYHLPTLRIVPLDNPKLQFYYNVNHSVINNCHYPRTTSCQHPWRTTYFSLARMFSSSAKLTTLHNFSEYNCSPSCVVLVNKEQPPSIEQHPGSGSRTVLSLLSGRINRLRLFRYANLQTKKPSFNTSAYYEWSQDQTTI